MPQKNGECMGGNPENAGVPYGRVSSDEQEQEGESLQEQMEALRELAEERGISIIDSVADGAETGTDFDREGIREVRYLASQDRVSYVLVDEIDRIGRHAAETLYYIYELNEECDVTIVTREQGELDISDWKDQIYVVMRTLSAQMTNETKGRRSAAARVHRYKNRNWTSAFYTIPLGYTELEDGWIAIDPNEVKTVKKMIENFFKADLARAYKETAEKTDGLPDEFDGAKVRELLKRPLYIGKPTTELVAQTDDGDTEMTTTVHDESLRIISDDTYDKIQERIAEIRSHVTGDGDATDDIQSLVEEFGPVAVVQCSEIIQVRCPSDGCDGRMVRNGRRELNSRIVHNYICKECGRQRKFPTKSEMDDLNSDEDDPDSSEGS